MRVSIDPLEHGKAYISASVSHKESRKQSSERLSLHLTIDRLCGIRDQIAAVLDAEVKKLNVMIEDRKIEDAYFAASHRIAEQTSDE